MPRDTNTIILTQNNLKTPLEWENQEKSSRGQSHIGRKKTRFYGKGKVRFGDRHKLGWR